MVIVRLLSRWLHSMSAQSQHVFVLFSRAAMD